jgi:mxaD protein
LTFKAAGKDKALVVWEGSLKLKDLAATPAESSNDATAVKVMTSLYRSGLDNLKKYQSNLKII